MQQMSSLQVNHEKTKEETRKETVSKEEAQNEPD